MLTNEIIFASINFRQGIFVPNKKRMRCFEKSKQRIRFFLYQNTEVSLKGLANLTCTRLICRFCIPKKLAASISPVSTKVFSHIVALLSSTVPLGFCCGGFSSTAGYVPGNEAHALQQ